MLVKVNDTEYKVYWKYDDCGNTKCIITEIVDNQKGPLDFKNPEPGLAWLSEKDDFVKAKGQKLSFARALQNAFNNLNTFQRRDSECLKTRKIFWRAYFDMRHENYECK